MSIYIASTTDKYELPLYVSDNLKDMAKWSGLSVTNVAVHITRKLKRKDGIKFEKVELEDEVSREVERSS